MRLLLKTYLLRFVAKGQTIALQPVLCGTNAEALAEARRGLEQRPDCEAVDVLLGDTEIFHIGRAD
ncbi:hypothetical protein QO010_004771 [Caulobacter ginsengisoli]|uniref:Uncharacterized protein n=1 Tax=Caulobacter ginsengisoli TaxID=400775 RepID=A0ABU0IY94_9CAUL|nr:hypothetical protein [Caulobacter ginsengisoli]MDQ0466974.1 hypothetical protein [Caulobacter ginsengisoli]